MRRTTAVLVASLCLLVGAACGGSGSGHIPDGTSNSAFREYTATLADGSQMLLEIDSSDSSTIEGEFSHLTKDDSDDPIDEGVLYGTLRGGNLQVTCDSEANQNFRLQGKTNSSGGFTLTRSDRPGETLEFSPVNRLFTATRDTKTFAFQEVPGVIDLSTKKTYSNGDTEYLGTCGPHAAKLLFRSSNRVEVTVTVQDKGHIRANFTGATLATISTLKQISTQATLAMVGDMPLPQGVAYLGHP